MPDVLQGLERLVDQVLEFYGQLIVRDKPFLDESRQMVSRNSVSLWLVDYRAVQSDRFLLFVVFVVIEEIVKLNRRILGIGKGNVNASKNRRARADRKGLL